MSDEEKTRFSEFMEKWGLTSPVEAGKEANKAAAEGGYYDLRLMEAIKKVNLAYEELLKEMRKLGLA